MTANYGKHFSEEKYTERKLFQMKRGLIGPLLDMNFHFY